MVFDCVYRALCISGNPVKISTFEDPETRVPAPNLDEHRDLILKELEV